MDTFSTVQSTTLPYYECCIAISTSRGIAWHRFGSLLRVRCLRWASGCCGLQVLGEGPGLLVVHRARWGLLGDAVSWGVIFSLPESTLLVGIYAAGLRLLWWCLLWLLVAVCSCIVGVVRLIGLVPSGSMLIGSGGWLTGCSANLCGGCTWLATGVPAVAPCAAAKAPERGPRSHYSAYTHHPHHRYLRKDRLARVTNPCSAAPFLRVQPRGLTVAPGLHDPTALSQLQSLRQRRLGLGGFT